MHNRAITGSKFDTREAWQHSHSNAIDAAFSGKTRRSGCAAEIDHGPNGGTPAIERGRSSRSLRESSRIAHGDSTSPVVD